MELEFDKEIDAILRKAGKGATAFAGAPAGMHLDPDELAAFAENALPGPSRANYVAHLADCDACRTTLSGLIMVNQEAASAAAFAPNAASALTATVPWYRRLFAMPNLAYTMGALVLVFSGLIGFLVFQSQLAGRKAEVSMAANSQPETKALSADEPAPQPFDSAAANTSANSNATTSSIESVARSGVEVGSTNAPTTTAAEERPAAKTDVIVTATEPTPTGYTAGAPIQPPPKDAPAVTTERDEKVEAKKQKENVVVTDELARNRADDAQRASRELSPSAKSADKLLAGPRQMNNQTQSQANNVQMDGANVASSLRKIGGKTFEFRDGVWYDTTYTGQSKKEYKRGTEKYLKLDPSLRSIADSVGGTVVIIWEGKAYKIR
jgi:hypothetical protein